MKFQNSNYILQNGRLTSTFREGFFHGILKNGFKTRMHAFSMFA